MPHRDDFLRLRDMVSVAEELLHFTEGKSYEDLTADRGLQYICIHCLEVLGEAASRMSSGFRESHPELPWLAMIAMRNRLIHGYFDIELSFVWQTISQETPLLLSRLRELLERGWGSDT